MFNAIDFGVFIGYFLVIVIIGFMAARKEKATVSGYFLAGNRLPWYAMGASIVAAGVSSEQFVGEIGYAYKVGMPVANWEWLVFPALTVMLWIFIPLYFRNRVSTMPEYLERRFGPRSRSLYAYLSVGSYVFANFALVFYTGGFALNLMWGVNKIAAIWLLALVTGAYTIYGGLISVAWTNFFQCLLLLGGGLYVFFAGMHMIHWDFAAILGTGQQAHLIAPADHPDVPWTALLILGLSTNVWYYSTNQYINQRCLAARSEWDAKMGILFAGGLQLLLPLATCFPGMIYRVINPSLNNPDAAYPGIVSAVVPSGFRGLVAAAVMAAIMSTIAGLVNSISTIVTLDIFRPWKGKDWSEARLVRFGQWAGGISLLIGALISPLVMHWNNIFRYCQDIWAPMAAPVVIVFLAGALWRPAKERGAVVCLTLAILTVPLTFIKQIFADRGLHFMPPMLENSLVFAGVVFLASIVCMGVFSTRVRPGVGAAITIILSIPIFAMGALSPVAVALTLAATVVLFLAIFVPRARLAGPAYWDVSMLRLPAFENNRWFGNLWLWWGLTMACIGTIYVLLW
jgi:SSS family solute:Na+ symporter